MIGHTIIWKYCEIFIQSNFRMKQYSNIMSISNIIISSYHLPYFQSFHLKYHHSTDNFHWPGSSRSAGSTSAATDERFGPTSRSRESIWGGLVWRNQDPMPGIYIYTTICYLNILGWHSKNLWFTNKTLKKNIITWGCPEMGRNSKLALNHGF